MFCEEFLSRLSQGAAVAEEGAVSYTHNQLEAAVRAKRSIEAIELIPEVCNGLVYMYVCVLWKEVVANEWTAYIRSLYVHESIHLSS